MHGGLDGIVTIGRCDVPGFQVLIEPELFVFRESENVSKGWTLWPVDGIAVRGISSLAAHVSGDVEGKTLGNVCSTELV